ncbi:MAG: DsrE family protein [Blastomonas sp.]
MARTADLPAYIVVTAALALAAMAVPAHAQNDSFSTGPLIEEFGPVANVDADMAIPANTKFHVAFDVSEGAKSGELSRSLVSVARFLNMHVRAGVPAENIRLAVVVHGKASQDLTVQSVYAKSHDGATNANAPLIAALTRHGVRIILCGQSASAYGIDKEDLLPDVEMALSAMTAHALLQQQGYTLNPF